MGREIKYKPWLNWWLLFVLIGFGSYVCYQFDILKAVNEADVTKLSFAIYGIFIVYSIIIGTDTYKMCKAGINKEITKRNEMGWFVSDSLLTLGMIGTVIGFIYMLSGVFQSIDPKEVATMKRAIAQMGVGMGTALYTTASGLICSLILKVQLFNLSHCSHCSKNECQ